MLVGLDEVQKLIEGLGPDCPAILEVDQDGEGSWAVTFDDEAVVVLGFDPVQQKLLLSTELGAPEDGQRLRVYETVLSYNLLQAETGGVMMGLGGAHGQVVQMCGISAGVLDHATLTRALEAFAGLARSWRRFVAAPPEGEDAAGPPQGFD